MSYFWIFLGGGASAIAQVGGPGFIARQFRATSPWDTLAVNVTGSFITGFLATLTDTDVRRLGERWHQQPPYEHIVLKMREMHLAGATVLRGSKGFGKSSRLHTAKILRLSIDLPFVIEIVDVEERINQFLRALEGMIGGGVMTLEKMRVVEYRAETQTGNSEKTELM